MGVLPDEVSQVGNPEQELKYSNNTAHDGSPFSNMNPPTAPTKYFDIKAEYATNTGVINYCRNENGGVQIPQPAAIETSEQANFLRTRGCKKEKKRTECINSAFSDLRRRIPNVPLDTKLSKIKTLRLATSYIAYLTDIVRTADPGDVRDGKEFHADLKALRTKEKRRHVSNQRQTGIGDNTQESGNQRNDVYGRSDTMPDNMTFRKKGRTGWPEAVWAMELENTSPSSFEQNRSPNNQQINIGVMQQSEQTHFTKVYTHQPTYPCGLDNNGVGNGHFGINHDPSTMTSHYSNPLLGYSLIPTVRETPGCPADSFPTYEEFIPYFPYPSLPLPAASSFSKRYSQFHQSGDTLQNSHGSTTFHNVPQMDMIPGSNLPEYNRAYASTQPDQTHANECNNTTNGYPSTMIAEITVIPGEGEDNFLWGSNCEELHAADQIKPLPTKFAELKTVSASSIRIATSTVNGSGIFTSPGRSELQCFGATRVIEPSNVLRKKPVAATTA